MTGVARACAQRLLLAAIAAFAVARRSPIRTRPIPISPRATRTTPRARRRSTRRTGRRPCALFQRAEKRHPDHADLQNNLGYAYRNLKQYDLAFKHYQRAIELDPRHRGAHEYIGEAYLMTGDLAERGAAPRRAARDLPAAVRGARRTSSARLRSIGARNSEVGSPATAAARMNARLRPRDPDVVYRRAVPADVAECIDLRGRTRENAISAARLQAMGITLQSWAADVADGTLPGYVCLSGSTLAGYCFGARDTGEIVVLALLPEFESKGIGKTLLNLIVEDFKALGHRAAVSRLLAGPRYQVLRFLPALGMEIDGHVRCRERRGARVFSGQRR